MTSTVFRVPTRASYTSSGRRNSTVLFGFDAYAGSKKTRVSVRCYG